MTAYSPTTGTYQMSPFSSPSTPKEHERGKGPSNGKKKLNNLSSPTSKESTAKDSDEFMVLLSKIERSSEKTMEIMKKLSSIQALANNRQLEDLIGISLVPCFLKREVEKTRELMTEVTKQRLLEKKSSRNPPRDSGPNQLCTLLNMEWIPSSSSPHSFAHLNIILTALNS
ncbi:centromere protein R isoform X5 [Peromyscus maniculatus bairdii]